MSVDSSSFSFWLKKDFEEIRQNKRWLDEP
jgi:hypothetical protein